MADYEARRHPTQRLCPLCLMRGRDSTVMKQAWGDIWRYTCADYSICEYVQLDEKEEP